jgi:hypothetical protein
MSFKLQFKQRVSDIVRVDYIEGPDIPHTVVLISPSPITTSIFFVKTVTVIILIQ